MPFSSSQERIFVGTFHKSGTGLMDAIWKQAAKRLHLSLWHMHDQKMEEPGTWDVCFHYHSNFGDAPVKLKHRGILVIRDPRDVIVSGAHYHCRAMEPWLHTPEERLGGMTYHQKINSLASNEDRLLFELENKGRKTIQQMLAAIEMYPSFRVVKLESLATDYDLMEFHKLFSYLGFHGADVPVLLAIALKNSIFSGQVKQSVHVRSGHPAQWKTHFTPRVLAAFEAALGDAAVRLGYEASAEAELSREGETAAPGLVSVPAALGPVRARTWRR